MANQLVGVHNYTDKRIYIGGTLPNGGQWGLGEPYRLDKGKHPLDFPIPDNSDSSRWFNTNHISLDILEPATNAAIKRFSIWDDDWKNFNIFYCEGSEGTDWKNTTKPMRGGNKGGNYARIVLHISEHPPKSGQYELSTVVLTDESVKKGVTAAFQAFKDHSDVKLTPGVPYTADQLRTHMAHPSFQAVKTTAAEGGFKSVAVIYGASGSFVVGGEAYTGVLMGIDGKESYSMSTESLSVGAQEGAVAFVGTYLSNEEPSKVGGVEFFAGVAAGLGVGIAFVPFVGLFGGSGFSIMATTGEELEMSVGVGYTSTKQIS